MKKSLKSEIKALRREQKLRDIQLVIQAKEYKRRLKDLNGEAGRLRSMQENYIPREVFDRTVNELNGKIQVTSDYKKEQEGRNKLTQWIPWIIAAISLAYAVFKK